MNKINLHFCCYKFYYVKNHHFKKTEVHINMRNINLLFKQGEFREKRHAINKQVKTICLKRYYDQAGEGGK